MAVDDPVPEWGVGDTLRTLGNRPSTFLQIAAALAPKTIALNSNTNLSLQDKLAKLAAVIGNSEDYGMAQQQAGRMSRIAQQQNSPFQPFEMNPDTTTPTGDVGPQGAMTAPPPSLGAPRQAVDAPQMYAQLLKDPQFIMQLGQRSQFGGFAGATDDLMRTANQRSKEYGMAAANRQGLIDQGYDPAKAGDYAAAMAKAGINVPADVAFQMPEARDAERYKASMVRPLTEAKLAHDRAQLTHLEQGNVLGQREIDRLRQEDALQQDIQSGVVDPNNFATLYAHASGKYPLANVGRAAFANNPVKAMQYYGDQAMTDLNKNAPPGKMVIVSGLAYGKDGAMHPEIKVVDKEMTPQEIASMIEGTTDVVAKMAGKGGLHPATGQYYMLSMAAIRRMPPDKIPAAVLALNRDVAGMIKQDEMVREMRSQTMTQREMTAIGNQQAAMFARAADIQKRIDAHWPMMDPAKMSDTQRAQLQAMTDQQRAFYDAGFAIGGATSMAEANKIRGSLAEKMQQTVITPAASGVPMTYKNKPVDHYIQAMQQTAEWRAANTAQRDLMTKNMRAKFEAMALQERQGGVR